MHHPLYFFGLITTHLSPLQLSSEGEETLTLNWLELLWSVLANWSTDDKLGLEDPGLWDLPVLDQLGVNERVVVLEVASETLSLESGPGSELVHGVGLGRPAWEAVGVEWEGLLLSLVDGAVVEEEDGAVCGFEPMWLSVSALSFIAVVATYISIFPLVASHPSAGTIGFKTSLCKSQSLSCSAPARKTTRVDWALKEDGTCLMIVARISWIRLSEIGEALESP